MYLFPYYFFSLFINALYNFKFSLANAEVMSFTICKFKPNKQTPYGMSDSDLFCGLWDIAFWLLLISWNADLIHLFLLKLVLTDPEDIIH